MMFQRYCDVSGKFSDTKNPEGPNGLRQLASHICELLMPNEAGAKAGVVQAGVVKWYAQCNPRPHIAQPSCNFGSPLPTKAHLPSISHTNPVAHKHHSYTRVVGK